MWEDSAMACEVNETTDDTTEATEASMATEMAAPVDSTDDAKVAFDLEWAKEALANAWVATEGDEMTAAKEAMALAEANDATVEGTVEAMAVTEDTVAITTKDPLTDTTDMAAQDPVAETWATETTNETDTFPKATTRIWAR